MELGILQFKKLISFSMGLIFTIMFIIILLFYVLGGGSGSNSLSLENMLASDEGKQLFNTVWRDPFYEVMEETNLILDISWYFGPSLFLDDPYTIDKKRAKEIIYLSIQKKEETYHLLTLHEYLVKLVKESEFNQMKVSDLEKYIEKNNSTSTSVVGNIPEEIQKYKKLNLALPVHDWQGIYEVGYYAPFGKPMYHYGMDIAVATGTTLYAAVDGEVAYIGYDSICGNTIIIRNGTLHVIYCHMNELSTLHLGDKVMAGKTILGYSGATGNVTGPHLHFQACSIKTNRAYDAIIKQEECYFNPRLLWNFN